MTDNANMPDGKYIEFPRNGGPLFVGGSYGTAVILSLQDYDQILAVIEKCEEALKSCGGGYFDEADVKEALAAIEVFRKGEKNAESNG